MGVTETRNKKNIYILALVSALMSLTFSFLGAPFLRALSVSAKPKIFWTAGILLTGVLLVAGFALTSIYIGAVWMTLGLYSEMEKRGINWRYASLVSLVVGFLFSVVSYLIIAKYFGGQSLIEQELLPIQTSLNKIFPESPIEISTLMGYVPGMFLASLLIPLAVGFMLEANVKKLFEIRHARVASGLKWLEFRLPDLFIWVSLFAGFFSLVPFGQDLLQKIALNIVIVSVFAFFFQGIAVIEFMTRAFRIGPFSKAILYILVVTQLAPIVSLAGLIDYWADFRKMLRKRIKAN